MRKGLARRHLTAALLSLLAAGALLPVALPSLVTRSGEELDQATRLLGRDIAERNAVVFLVTFDEPVVREWISPGTCPAPGTRSVPARHGRGRRFDGRLQTFVETPVRWSRVGPDYTIALWARLDGRSADQDILFCTGNARQTGFRLEGGVLKFDVPAPDGNYQTLECPFENFDRFALLAATVSRTDGRAVLYLNGERRDEIPVREVAMPDELIEFGTRRWFAARHPIFGTLDETVIWNRALDPEEIRRLFRSRQGVLDRLSSTPARLRWRLISLLDSAWRGAARFFDGVRAGMRCFSSPAGSSSLLRLDLHLSQSDRRHFAAAHRASRESGRRIDEAANLRKISFRAGGETRRGLLQLYGSDTSYPDNPRPAYVLQAAEGEILPGTDRLLLCPPENVSFLRPLVENELAATMGIPRAAEGLLTLWVNNRFLGVYYYQDWQRFGISPGDYLELFQGPRYARDWKTPFRHIGHPRFYGRLGRYHPPLSEETRQEVFDRVSRRYRPVLMNDPASSLSQAERARQIDLSREQRAEIWPSPPPGSAAARTADFICEYLVLGRNPSPSRVTEDLDLSGPCPDGVTVEWSSSHPEIIDAEGRVARPDGRVPLAVHLTATIKDGAETRTRTLAFRVMPKRVDIPSLMIYARQPVQKVRRVDARIDYYPADGDSDPFTLWATQDKRGGISHRGNTSYWKVKKLLSIRTDRPHRLFGESGSRHLQFINSFEDESFIRNRLCFDLFREWGAGGGRNYAPRVTWVEVFCNGVYQGLHEICERVDEQTLGFPGGDPDPVHPPVVYKHETVEPRLPYMRQERPNRRRGLLLEPFFDLESFLTRSPAEEFARGLADRVDPENALDFHLLLNLTQNINGYPFAFAAHDILARGGRPDDRFFFVPWDFAVTFRSHWRWHWMANLMQRRMQNELPGYRARLRDRWRILRQDVLDPDRLAETINTHAARIRGYARWDYVRWDYPPSINHRDAVSDLITVVRSNIEKMDDFLDSWEENAPGDPEALPGDSPRLTRGEL